MVTLQTMILVRIILLLEKINAPQLDSHFYRLSRLKHANDAV